jgi:hypothetical protein
MMECWNVGFLHKATLIAAKDVIPAKAGIQKVKDWIPGQARNDNLYKTYFTVYDL